MASGLGHGWSVSEIVGSGFYFIYQQSFSLDLTGHTNIYDLDFGSYLSGENIDCGSAINKVVNHLYGYFLGDSAYTFGYDPVVSGHDYMDFPVYLRVEFAAYSG